MDVAIVQEIRIYDVYSSNCLIIMGTPGAACTAFRWPA